MNVIPVIRATIIEPEIFTIEMHYTNPCDFFLVYCVLDFMHTTFAVCVQLFMYGLFVLIVAVGIATIAFLARDSMLSALYAIARPSVRLSVCLSVRHTGGSVENG